MQKLATLSLQPHTNFPSHQTRFEISYLSIVKAEVIQGGSLADASQVSLLEARGVQDVYEVAALGWSW